MDQVTPETAGFSAQRLRRVDATLQAYIDQNKLAGIVAWIARHGKVVYAKTFGMQDIEAGQSMQQDTLFRIYSMSKPITSVAAMMLHEQAYFHLDDPVARYLPAFEQPRVFVGMEEGSPRFEPAARPITIRHLLTHTAGLSYGFDPKSYVDSQYQEHVWQPVHQKPETTLQEMIDAVGRMPLLHQPGSAWNYSIATDVLGCLVQVLAGMPFEDYLRQYIFEPLGMVDTFFTVPAAKIDRLAANYGPADGGGLKVIDRPRDSEFTRRSRPPSGGGGLLSTASDYMRFAQMMLHGGEWEGTRLLGRKTVEWMTMNHLPEDMHPFDDRWRGFGLGVYVQLDPARAPTLGSRGEYGWGGAAGTRFWVDPQEGLAAVLMLQFMPNDRYPVLHDFRTVLYQALVS